MSNKPNIYHVICFTTNAKSFEPISILQKYIISSEYYRKQIIKFNPLEFHYKIDTKEILISFHQIIDLTKENFDPCYLADSYLIIMDLENENTFKNLDTIINFMINLCDIEKTIFILGLYSNAQKIKNDLNEENVKEFLDKKNLIYEYVESNFDLINDFNKSIDYIIEEGIKKVEKKLKDGELNTKNDSESKSNCDIF